MKYILSFFLFVCISIQASAQVKFVSRFEIDSDLYDPLFEMMRIESGIVSFRTIPDKGRSFRRIFQIFKVDVNMNTDGLIEYPIREGYDMKGYDIDGENLFILFQKGYSLNADKYIFKIDLVNNQGFEFEANNLLDTELVEFLVEEDKAIFMGNTDGRPVLQIFDLENKNIYTIQGIYGNDTQILQIRKMTEIQAFEVVLSRRGQYKNRELQINTYDLNGNLLREIEVDQFGEDRQEILEGILLPQENYQQAMIGSFGLDRRDAYQGMYIMNINEFGEYDFDLYTLEDFPNFFNYLPEKLKEKRDREIEKNVEKGKDSNIRNIYAIRDVRVTPDAYHIYFDHFNIINSRGNNRPGYFSPTSIYRYDRASRMGYSPFFNNVNRPSAFPNTTQLQLTTEYKYISAHFIKVGKEGNVLWDNASTYDDFLTAYPEAFGEIAVVGNDLYHLFVKNLLIKMSFFRNGEKVFDNIDFEIKLTNEEERIRETNASSLKLTHWYGSYFLLSGTQRIKFLDESGKEDNREVFFMTKILVDGDLYEFPEDSD